MFVHFILSLQLLKSFPTIFSLWYSNFSANDRFIVRRLPKKRSSSQLGSRLPTSSTKSNTNLTQNEDNASSQLTFVQANSILTTFNNNGDTHSSRDDDGIVRQRREDDARATVMTSSSNSAVAVENNQHLMIEEAPPVGGESPSNVVDDTARLSAESDPDLRTPLDAEASPVRDPQVFPSERNRAYFRAQAVDLDQVEGSR
jgi:hypothetical protein